MINERKSQNIWIIATLFLCLAISIQLPAQEAHASDERPSETSFTFKHLIQDQAAIWTAPP